MHMKQQPEHGNYLTIEQLERYLQGFNIYECAAREHHETTGRFLLAEEIASELSTTFSLLPTDIRNANADAFLHSGRHSFFLPVNPRVFMEYEYFSPDYDIYIHTQPRYTSSPMQSHMFFEICCQYSGYSMFEIPENDKLRRIHLHEGDFLFIPPDQPHKTTVESDSILLNIGIRKSTFLEAFSHNIPEDSAVGSFFSGIFEADVEKRYILFQTGKSDIIWRPLQSLMLTYCTPSLYSKNVMNLELSLLMLKLLQHFSHSTKLAYNSSSLSSRVSGIMSYVENHYTEVTVQDVAKKFGYAPDYLNQTFKAATGHTLGETIRNLKMQKALSLLKNSDMSVQEISDYLGYMHPANLIRNVKKYCDMTPAQYRRSVRKASGGSSGQE